MRPWFRIAVIFISISLIIVIFRSIDIFQFLGIFLNLKIIFFIAGLILILSSQFLMAYRWKISVPDSSGILYSSFLYRTVTSYFFNNLFLGVFGSDIYKALRIEAKTGRFIALFSVAYNRIINTYAALLIPVLVLPLIKPPLIKNYFLYYSVTVSLVFFIIFMLILLFQSRLMDVTERFLYKIPDIKNLRYINLIKTMSVSILIMINNISAHYFFCLSLDINISFPELAVLYSVCAVLISIPVSINGIGVREGVFIFAFSFWGISQERALAFSFLSFSSIIALSILGGSVFVVENLIKLKNSRREIR